MRMREIGHEEVSGKIGEDAQRDGRNGTAEELDDSGGERVSDQLGEHAE